MLAHDAAAIAIVLTAAPAPLLPLASLPRLASGPPELQSISSRRADPALSLSPHTNSVYDDDGNNEMDADELVVAWKKVTDKKISTKEAQELISQGATNGNATLDKDEFVQVVRAHA